MKIEDLYDIFRKFPEITTDSRDVRENSIFFALKGESFDGNNYAVESVRKGAAYAVIDSKMVYDNADGDVKDRLILTSDVLLTLQALANYHRCQLGTTIIGVTGTNGKTTTKELIAAVLSKKYNVLYTQGNFNNHIGVPKTLLRLTDEHQIAVVEMGANHPGEIKTLVNIVQPDYGIITNVGKAHLLGFGSFEGVIKTKGELYDYLREDSGTVFINNDNEHLRKISAGLRLIRYGRGEDKELLVRGELVSCNPFLTFTWNVCPSVYSPMEVKTRLVGAYNLDNALAAACVGTLFAVSPEDVSDAIREYTPSNNRSQLVKTEDNSLVVDAYNANPTSMAAALENFRLMTVQHKMAVLGDMKELGDVSLTEHENVIKTLLNSDFEMVCLVGDEFRKAAETIDEGFFTNNRHFLSFKDVRELTDYLKDNKPKGMTILIKGSNSTHLTDAVGCF